MNTRFPLDWPTMESLTRLSDDLAFAHSIIDRVDQLTRDRFGAADLRVQTKLDLTPVSDADKAAESLIRSMLGHSRSRDSIYGEEEGGSLAHVGRRWIIDPIDGTKNYVRGVPVWATLLALEEDGEIKLGIVSAPALKRRWWAGLGLGAYSGSTLGNAKKIHVSGVSSLKEASFSYSSLAGWAEREQLRAFLRLSESCWRTRAFGDFWSYMLLAEGAVDIAAEPDLEIYDMAALVPIVTEAGGTFTSLGGELGPWGGNAVATNGFLHEAVLEVLGSVSDSQ